VTREESLTIVQMILTHWRGKDWTKEEIDAYARSIQDLDAALTTSAVARAAKEIKYRPPIAELREYVRAERNRLAPAVRPVDRSGWGPIPLWVKRWICARMLYAHFGRDRDLRRFPEQGDFGDLTREVMPENEWLEEANSLTDADFRKAFQKATWA
jgi:hypothetical protein